MIVLYILLGIVLFFALIFSMRIKVYIRLEDELRVRAGLGPVVLTVVPSKPKKPLDEKDFTYKRHQKRLEEDRETARKKAEKQKKKKAEKAEKDAKKKQAKKLAEEAETASRDEDETNSSNKLETILSLVSFGVGELGKLASWLHTDIKKLEITVGGEDAAAIALNYGRISTAAALLIELLDYKTALKNRPNRIVSVEPDFTAPKTIFHVDLSLKLRLVSFLRIGCHALVWFVKQKIHS